MSGKWENQICERCERVVPVESINEDGVCEDCAVAAAERYQEHLMEGGGGPTLIEQQRAAYKIKRGLR